MATFHGTAKPGDLCLIIQGPAVEIPSGDLQNEPH